MQLEGLVIPVSFGLGGLLKGVDMITDLISGAVGATFDWAEGMDKLGDVTGMTAEQTAAWSFVAKKAGVEVDALANSSVILAKGLFDSEGKLSTTGKALENFGVSIHDANGNVKDQSVLMDDIAARYQEFGTQTERVDFLTNVFGRSGAQLVDVFDTLAQEGGIDAVGQKVKDLGLTLDPAQYEDFQRNLAEVGMTFTGLAATLVGPLMPAAQSLLNTFTKWLQSPWIADSLKSIAENIGILASDIALGVETGNWDLFFADFKAFTGIDIQPLIDNMQMFSDWLTNTGIPKWNEFITATKSGWADFKLSSTTETDAIKGHWQEMLDAIEERINIVFGKDGQKPLIDWKAVGITALQAVDIAIWAIAKSFEFFNGVIQKSIDLMGQLADASTTTAVYVPPGASGAPGQATGGYAGGLTWVGEHGPELVNLPNGSYVNNSQSSSRMANQPVQAYIDYDELGRTLARVLGQQMQRA